MDSGEFVSIPAIDYGSQRTARGRKAIQEACGASRIHVCTQFMANLAAQHGVQPTVIPLTSVTRIWRRDRSARRRRADREQTLTLVQVASLSRVKNQRMLIDALAMVRQSIDARLDLVGEDTLGGELQRHAVDERRRRSCEVPRLRAAGSTRGDLRRRRSLRAVVAARSGGRFGARSRGCRTADCRHARRLRRGLGTPIARWRSRRSTHRRWHRRFSRCTPIRRGRARWRRGRRPGRSNTTPHGWPIGLRRCIERSPALACPNRRLIGTGYRPSTAG